MRARAWRRSAMVALCFGWLACASAPRKVDVAPVPIPDAPAALIDVTLFLIGDAGAPAALPDSEPVLLALRTAAASVTHAFVVFLGDNVYPRGMPDSGQSTRPEAERRLTAQLAVLRQSGAHGIFVPGDPDWDKHAAGGRGAVRRWGRFNSHSGDGGVLRPSGWCSGCAVF